MCGRYVGPYIIYVSYLKTSEIPVHLMHFHNNYKPTVHYDSCHNYLNIFGKPIEKSVFSVSFLIFSLNFLTTKPLMKKRIFKRNTGVTFHYLNYYDKVLK